MLAVTRWLAKSCVLPAQRGSHMARAKPLGIASVAGGKQQDDERRSAIVPGKRRGGFAYSRARFWLKVTRY